MQSGAGSGLVTLPIHKRAVMAAGFAWPGHTGWLEARCNAEAVMLFVAGGLKVAPLTIHVPLAEVPGLITAEAVSSGVRRLSRGIAEGFAIARPRIAVAGLNPHAGEEGTIGREEQDIIAPALAALNEAEGDALEALGPFPADTLFHQDAHGAYDAVLALYHDQALIGVKTLDFWGGAQMSLGLPIVRTSPDHGTALPLAGTGRARTESFHAALRLAREAVERRDAASGA